MINKKIHRFIEPLSKLKLDLWKVIRYIKLTGFSRTLSKVNGVYHLDKTLGFSGDYWENNKKYNSIQNDKNSNVAIIGCGYYAHANIAYYLRKANKFFLRATLDIESSRSRSLCNFYKGDYATTSLQKILDDPQIKIVYISTKHSFHADYAIKCIEAGKDVHIEKPHVTTIEQLDKLSQVIKSHPDVKVFLGFNRPKSKFFNRLKNELENYSGDMMINWFLVGHHLEGEHWYYDEEEGGRILGNLCHWTDATLNLIGVENAFPCTINPTFMGNTSSDFVTTIIFNAGSTVVMSFSAKGWVSRGVIEELNVQKGDCIASINSFDTLKIDSKSVSKTWKNRHRDQGHKLNIINSYNNSLSLLGKGETFKYVDSTARLFLSVKEAITSGNVITLDIK